MEWAKSNERNGPIQTSEHIEKTCLGRGLSLHVGLVAVHPLDEVLNVEKERPFFCAKRFALAAGVEHEAEPEQ